MLVDIRSQTSRNFRIYRLLKKIVDNLKSTPRHTPQCAILCLSPESWLIGGYLVCLNGMKRLGEGLESGGIQRAPSRAGFVLPNHVLTGVRVYLSIWGNVLAFYYFLTIFPKSSDFRSTIRFGLLRSCKNSADCGACISKRLCDRGFRYRRLIVESELRPVVSEPELRYAPWPNLNRRQTNRISILGM